MSHEIKLNVNLMIPDTVSLEEVITLFIRLIDSHNWRCKGSFTEFKNGRKSSFGLIKQNKTEKG